MAVHVPVAELPSRMAGELVQTGPAASRAALRWAAVGGVHRDVLVVTLACPTARGGETQVLAVAVVFPAQVGSCGGGRELLKPFFSFCVCLRGLLLPTSLAGLAERLQTDHPRTDLEPKLLVSLLILVPELGLVWRKDQVEILNISVTSH